MPIAVHPGLALTGAKVRDAVTNAQAQFDASVALHERFKTPVVMSAMDLSVEADAFGCEINLPENEVPTVLSKLVTSPEQGRVLPIPKPGDKRTGVYLETVSRLCKMPARPTVLAGCIGPFSLASRLVGMSEACSLTITDPDWMHLMLDKAAQFLSAYAQAFKGVGADGILMAEPGAGLLSPKSLAEFSSPYIRRIVSAVVDGRFELILHNCAAKLVHLPATIESGAKILHFGAPMDLPAALAKVPNDVILCGNLDPTRVFLHSKPDEVIVETQALAKATQGFRNYVISSGCDVPPGTPLANLEAFFSTAVAK